jgi:S-adenosylmethionine:tRNA ribosyltransferase-isomerase
MSDQKKLATQYFDYHLPEDRIPQYPVSDRAQSKLLVYNKGDIQKDIFRNIARHIPRCHLMVYNNARVVFARLIFQKETGAEIEIFCLEPYQPADYSLAFQQNKAVTWRCLVGNLKKWKGQPLKAGFNIQGRRVKVSAHLIERKSQHVLVEFKWNDPEVTFGMILDQMGRVPIPPYLKRESEEIDKKRYQTVYSKIRGSVAAPTAGLHFSDQVFRDLDAKGITSTELTLHVGAGTFRPVQAERIDQHPMHLEHFSVTLKTLDLLIDHYPDILPVGTTTLRTLESLYWLGIKLQRPTQKEKTLRLDQWEHLDIQPDIPVPEALDHIRQYLKQQGEHSLDASTRIMIAPGYQFKLTKGLITNFHQPKSTLLMLIAAFVGDDWKKIYRYALDHGFRFLSYGDSSLLFP